MKDGVENYLRYKDTKASSTRARTKMLASLERRRFDQGTLPKPDKQTRLKIQQ